MPRIEIPCIEEHERETVEEALQIISSAVLHDDISIKLESDQVPPKFTYNIIKTGAAYSGYCEYLESQADIILEQINKGSLTVVTDKYGSHKIIENKRVITSEYPKAFMTPEEETEFNNAIKVINYGRSDKQCKFETYLDDTAHIIFRYSVADDAPDKANLHNAIKLVINMINSGKAVRIEMPGNSIMLTPRLF